MRLSDRVFLTLSGETGCSLSHPSDCNAFAVDCGGPVILIDAGVGVETSRLLANLHRDQIEPHRITALLLTHAHLDHSGGARALRDALGVPVWSSLPAASALEAGDEDAISLAAAKRAGIYDASFSFSPCPVERRLSDGECCTVGDCTLRAAATPGHSGDMMTYLVQTPSELLAFVGDTVFHSGRVLMQDTWDCSPAECARSLRKLAALPIDGLFPGHGIWSLADGASQVRKSLAFLDRLVLPPNAL